MKNKNAFTLIEVMVVLSVLALVAVLAYSFMGGVMKEASISQAVTQISNDFRIKNDAWDEYYRRFGIEPGTSDDIVNAGILKAWPNSPPPAAWYDDGGGSLVYWTMLNGWTDLGGPTTSTEIVTAVNEVSDAVCREYNKRHTDLGETIWDYVGLGFKWPTVGDGLEDEFTFCARTAQGNSIY